MKFLPRFSESAGPANLLDLLPDVVVGVAEQAFFAWAERCESFETSQIAATASTAMSLLWLRARVDFTGERSGFMEVCLNTDLAGELGAVMLGETAGEDLPDALLKDVAGELANMLCGSLLRRAGHAFQVKPPRTCVAEPPSSREGYTLFLVNDRLLLVKADIHQEPV